MPFVEKTVLFPLNDLDQKTLGHTHEGLLLSSLSYFTVLYTCFYANSIAVLIMSAFN